jgi:hypothetical protein
MCDTLRNTLSRGRSAVPVHPLAMPQLDPLAPIFLRLDLHRSR